MPFDHGLRLNNRQRIANAREKPIEANCRKFACLTTRDRVGEQAGSASRCLAGGAYGTQKKDVVGLTTT
jgi:hypothetical protein